MAKQKQIRMKGMPSGCSVGNSRECAERRFNYKKNHLCPSCTSSHKILTTIELTKKESVHLLQR